MPGACWWQASWPFSPPGSALESAAASSRTGPLSSDSPARSSVTSAAPVSPASASGSSSAASSVDKIGYGKLIVAAFLFHMLSALVTFGATQDRIRGRPTCSSTSARSCSGWPMERSKRWQIRSSRRSSRKIAPTTSTSSMPAGRPGWCSEASSDGFLGDGMHLSWKLQLGLFLRADRALWHGVPRPEVPEVGGFSQGSHIGRCSMKSDCSGHWWRASSWACSSRSNWAQSSRSSRAAPSSPRPAWGYLGVGVAFALLMVVGVKTNFSAAPCFSSCFHHARTARRGRARHRQLDSEHHRQHPDAGAGQGPVRLHVAVDVLAALLRALHREAPQALAYRPVASSARCWPSSASE